LVFFNADEHGLIGSKAYARAIAATKREVAGVFQMDMVGFRKRPAAPPATSGSFEVHAACPSDLYADYDYASAIARLVAAAAISLADFGKI
jgi:Zn-dependent M28 family amino/carboxypeptidase